MFYTNISLLGNNVLVRGIDDNGLPYNEKVAFKPTMFIQSDKESKFKTLDGHKVSAVQPGNIKETKAWMQQYEDVGGFKIYGNDNYLLQYTTKKFKGEIDYDPSKIRIWNIDIEVDSSDGFPHPHKANSEVTAITVHDSITDKYHTWGLADWENTRDDIEIVYKQFTQEHEMLRDFLSHWEIDTPNVVTGWNIVGFDIPYIVNRVAQVFGGDMVKKLSPWGFVREKTHRGKFGKDQTSYELYGVAQLDYLELYQKFTYSSQESYKLDHIAYVELGERKLSYDEVNSLHELAETNYQKFIDYNIKDVELVKRIDDKMKLIDLVYAMAYDAKIQFNDVYSPVKTWDALIYSHLKNEDTVVPPVNRNSKKDAYEGAYVKDPLVGFHDWVMSFDLNSLYPHLIMQYNISPETLVGTMSGVSVNKLLDKSVDTTALQKQNVTVTPNGMLYSREKQGVLPALMLKLYNERKIFKGKMLKAQQDKEDGKAVGNSIAKFNNIQMAKKIQLNSAYGALGNQYFRYYELRNAEAITTSGQLSIRWIEKALNKYLNKVLKTDGHDYIIAIDTDSVYVNMGDLVNRVNPDNPVDFLDKVARTTIEPFIDKSYEELAEYMNAYEQKMQMGREVIADRGIWTAKKRYALNVWDNEGVRYTQPKMKVMGMEIVKSSTPEVVRNTLRKAVEIMLNDDEDTLQTYVAEFKDKFYKLPPEDIAFPRGINELDKYIEGAGYRKGTPIHVKSAIVYNNLINKHGLDKKYPLIQSGDKIKFLYLKVPNKWHERSLGFQTNIPEVIGIDRFVDYDMQFEKTFISPLEGILRSIGWNYEETASLESFFG